MREIKFRAWDTRTKYMATQGTPDLETLHRFIDHWAWEQHEIDNGVIILMQYTGLTDKNGKEIYEGDIVVRENYPKGKVVFHKGGFYLEFGLPTDTMNYQSLRTIHPASEAIGNIYENPELVK